MAAPAYTTIKFHSHTDWVIPFKIEKNGAAFTIAGSTITAKLRDQIDDSAAVATFSCSIVDGENGEGQCVLAAATTGALTYDTSSTDEWTPTIFFADIIISLSAGTVIGPIRFKVLARKAVTR